MICKICHQNETDATSGICDECFFREMTAKPLDMGEGHTEYNHTKTRLLMRKKITGIEKKKRFDIIRGNIGEDLFNQLSDDDKMLMANTAGVIDFGYPIDLDNLEKDF